MSQLGLINIRPTTFSGVLIPARTVPRTEFGFKLFTDSGDWIDLDVSENLRHFFQQHLWFRFTLHGDTQQDGRLKVKRVQLEKDKTPDSGMSITA